jgi:hypothetical protein
MDRVGVILLTAFALAGCAPLISAGPSDMVVILQETHPLEPTQVSELQNRLSAFASENGLSLAINGSAGDGSPFVIEMKDKKDASSIIVASPFEPTTFVFGLYSRSPAKSLTAQRVMFANAIRAATAK